MVVIVEAGVAHARVLGDSVMAPNPLPCRLRPRVGAADAAVEIALQAGVSHAAVRAVLAGLALAIGGVDEAAIRTGPRLVVRRVPVLTALQENDRLAPQRRVPRVIGLLERLQRLLEVRQ